MNFPRSLLLLRFFCELRSNLPVYAVLSVGVALSVFVLAWLLALRQGFVDTFAASGRPDHAMVLSNAATSEVASFIRIDHAMALAQHGAIARAPDGKALASPELFSLSYLELEPGALVSVSLRGLSPLGASLRSQLRIVQGRMFVPGARELLVGHSLLGRLPALGMGQEIELRGVRWKIVGSFKTGDASQSEFWGDVHSVQNAFGQRGFQSILARFNSPADFERFQADVRRDTSLNAKVLSERDYYMKNSTTFPRAIGLIALLVGGVMACAAAVNASNSMLYLMDRRRQMMAVVLAIGFSPATVFVTMLVEASIVAGAGALVGWTAAYLVFDGQPVSTFNMQSYELVAFNYSIGWVQAQVGLALGVLAVLVGQVAVVAKLSFTPVMRLLARD